MKFYIPPNLQKDFQDALLTPIATQFTLNFVALDIVNAIVPEINYREKAGNSIRGDKPIYADINKNLKIGDYFQDTNGIYIITQLQREKFPQCFKVYTAVCNTKFTVTRFQTVVYDNLGNVITPEGNNPIASNIYCSSLVAGAQFRQISGGIGIVPSDQSVIQTQFKDTTKNITIGDNYYWFSSKYRVISVDYSQVNLDFTSGLISFTGEKVVS